MIATRKDNKQFAAWSDDLDRQAERTQEEVDAEAEAGIGAARGLIIAVTVELLIAAFVGVIWAVAHYWGR